MDRARDNPPPVLEGGLPAALDDSPTIPLALLPGAGLGDSMAIFEPGQRTPQGEETPDGLAIKNIFPWLIQDAIDMGAVAAGTRAREARLALSEQSSTAGTSPGGAWRPIANRRVSPSNNDLPRLSTLPTPTASTPRRHLAVTHNTPPSTLPSQPSCSPPAYSSALPRDRDRGDRTPPQSASSTQSHHLSTRLARPPVSLTGRHRSPPHSPTSPFAPYHLAPLPSIPETPKDLDVPPEGSWALRGRASGKTLGKSRSQPGVRRRGLSVTSLRRTKSSSGAKVAGPPGAGACDVSASSQTRVLRPNTTETAQSAGNTVQSEESSRRPAKVDDGVAKILVDASCTPSKDPDPSPSPSGMKRSPRIQSFIRSKASIGRSSLGQLDVHASLLVRPNRSASAPTPPPTTSHAQLQPSGPPPPPPSWSEPNIPSCLAVVVPAHEVDDVFYTPQLTPALALEIDVSSRGLDDQGGEAEERTLAREAITDAETWLWPTPPPRLAPAATPAAPAPCPAAGPAAIIVDERGEASDDTTADDVSRVQTPLSASAARPGRYGMIEWVGVGRLEDVLDEGKVAGEWRMKADVVGKSVESLDIMETLEGGGVDVWDLDL